MSVVRRSAHERRRIRRREDGHALVHDNFVGTGQLAVAAALGREIDATFATGGRTSTALLDRAPAGTTIWVGLPNVSNELSEAWALVEKRVAENPVLADWWAQYFASGDDGAQRRRLHAREREIVTR